MAKFHINSKTGEPGACQATQGKCPFGGASEHYTSKQAARDAFERFQKDNALRPARVFIARASDADDALHESLKKTCDDTGRELQDFVTTANSFLPNPQWMHKFADLELKRADANFRYRANTMVTEARRHTMGGVDDAKNKKDTQSFLFYDFSKKARELLEKARQFGGGSSTQALIAKAAEDIEVMNAQGAKDDERSALYYTASLTHALLRNHDARHRLNGDSLPDDSSIGNYLSSAGLLLQLEETDRSWRAASKALFPHNDGYTTPAGTYL